MSITKGFLRTTILAAAIAATACGGNNSSSPLTSAVSLSSSDPLPATSVSAAAPVQTTGTGSCALLTQDEAASALGKPVPNGTSTSASIPVKGVGSIQADYCSFGSDVLVARFDLGSAGATLFAQYRQSLSTQSDFQEVSGVGDEAFFAKGQLAVRKGTAGLIIDVGQNTGSLPAEQANEKDLATIALGRL